MAKMRTDNGYYYVFLNEKDFWDKVNYYKSLGCRWVFDSDPCVTLEDMPVVLSVDFPFTVNPKMIHGVVKFYESRHFEEPKFVELYKQEQRKLKLNKILKT